MIIGAATPFGPILAVSNVLLASLWLWFTINGYLAGRDRRFASHRRHMVLSATLALSIITNRVWTPILFIALHPLQDSVFHGDEELYLWVVAGIGAWLGWTIPTYLVHRWLTRTPLIAAVVNFSAVRHAIGVISGRLGTTRRRTYLDEAGHGNRIQRQDRAGYPRFRAGLGSVRRADRTEGRAQRPLSRVGRHRHRDVGLLRRTGGDAHDEPHRRARCAAVPVPHHRAVLADARLAAHRTQRHHRRHGHHRGVHRRLPELQRPHPGRHRAAVGGARRTGLQHLLRRQVAPDAAGGIQPRGDQTTLAAEPRVRAVLRVHGRRDRPVVSRPGLRQPSRRAAGHAGGRVSPVEGHRRQDHRVHPRRQSHRTGQAVVLLCLPRCGARAAPRLQGLGGPLRRQVRHGLREVPRNRAGEPEEARHRAAGHRIVAGEPVSRCEGPQRRGMAVPGHCAAVGHAQRRGEAAVLPDGRGVRRVPVLHRRPDRQDPRLSRRVRAAGQHHHRGDLRQRRQRRRRPERLGQRGQVLQRLHRHRRREHEVLRPSRRPGDLQPLSDRLGDGVQHALQAVQALRIARGRDRRHRDRLLAQRHCRTWRSARQLRQRLRHHADGLRPASDSPRRPRSAGSRRSRSTA